MSDGMTPSNAATDLWSRMPALMFQACQQGVAMEVEIANAVVTAAREIGTQQLELVKVLASAGVPQATTADMTAGRGDAAEAFGAIARSIGECSRRIFEANQQCLLGSLRAMTGSDTPSKPAAPAPKPAAH